MKITEFEKLFKSNEIQILIDVNEPIRLNNRLKSIKATKDLRLEDLRTHLGKFIHCVHYNDNVFGISLPHSKPKDELEVVELSLIEPPEVAMKEDLFVRELEFLHAKLIDQRSKVNAQILHVVATMKIYKELEGK